MRHLPMKLGAALFALCLFAGVEQASAMPASSLDGLTKAAPPIEKVGYYRRYGGYYPYRQYARPYPYYRPYGYYRPYPYYGYGYGHRPYRRHGYNWRY